MSCYVVGLDHIGFLVNLGDELGVRSLCHGGANRCLELDEGPDRVFVACALIVENRASVAHRYGIEPAELVAPQTFRRVPILLSGLREIAQALQWVGCYRYQSCEHPEWRSSFAAAYTERLTAELIRRVIDSFPTTWDYDGPCLAEAE